MDADLGFFSVSFDGSQEVSDLATRKRTGHSDSADCSRASDSKKTKTLDQNFAALSAPNGSPDKSSKNSTGCQLETVSLVKCTSSSQSTIPTQGHPIQHLLPQWKSEVPVKDSEKVSYLIVDIFNSYLVEFSKQNAINSLSILSDSFYLENLLWPLYSSKSSQEHILSVALLVSYNIKTQKTNDPLHFITKDAKKFTLLFESISEMTITSESVQFKNILLTLLQKVFESMDIPLIRSLSMSYLQISILKNTTKSTLDGVISQHEQLLKVWNSQEKKYKKASAEQKKELDFQSAFFSRIIGHVSKLLTIASDVLDECIELHVVLVCEILIILLTQLPTRRYLNSLILDHGLLTYLTLSPLYILGKKNHENIKLHSNYSSSLGVSCYKFAQALEQVSNFPIHDFTGKPLSSSEVEHLHYQRLISLQKVLFGKYRNEFEEYCLMNCGTLGKPSILEECFGRIPFTLLLSVSNHAGIRTQKVYSSDTIEQHVLIDLLVCKYGKRIHAIENVENLPVYPTDLTMFDELNLPESVNIFHPLPLPRLNLQFLSIQEYVYRLFQIYIMSASVDMRYYIESIVKKSNPRYDPNMSFQQHQTLFTTSTRFGVPIEQCKVIEVGKSLIGQTKPSRVILEITYDLNRFLDASLRDEWDSFRINDVIYLLSLKCEPQIYKDEIKTDHLTGKEFTKTFGLQAVRGCQIVGLVGDDGKLMGHFDVDIIHAIIEAVKKLPPDQLNKHKKEAMLKEIEDSGFSRGIYGSKRTLRVSMDVNQYANDLDSGTVGQIYEWFNFMIRKEPKENACKTVVESMKEMSLASSGINSSTFLPDFVRDIWLGIGDMKSAQFLESVEIYRQFIFDGVFCDSDHLKESFTELNVVFPDTSDTQNSFLISFPSDMFPKKQSEIIPSGVSEIAECNQMDISKDDISGSIVVRHCPSIYYGPFVDPPTVRTPEYRFTPQQVAAIHSGISHGLTLINGVHGSGKTEVAARIITNLLRNFPNQRILLVSSQQNSVNTLFEKVLNLTNVDQRFLVRIGFDGGDSYFSTEELLETDRYGRLTLFTSRRADLLDKVDKLAASLGILGAHGNSCETATYFYQTHIQTRWSTFHFRILNDFEKLAAVVKKEFPFSDFFNTALTQLFPETATFEESIMIAEGCYRYIENIFKELEDMRAFEILRTNVDRANYLVVKEAKFIAMNTSFACLKRSYLSQLGFTFDTIIYEDAGTINEIESLMSIQLQNTSGGKSRLRRVIMLGNGQGLTPVCKHNALESTNVAQSLFMRLLRLGVPSLNLESNMRFSRSFLSDVSLHGKSSPALFLDTVNPGFCFDSQFIDVPTFMGMNEHQSKPNYYQNLGEAEYLVATFMYMRLLGYPGSEISILAMTEGQRDLIIDVLNKRCSWNPIFGKPGHVSFIDSYIGYQNKYVLLSLVRTQLNQHVLDNKKLEYALSRASHGLYVFGRMSTFEQVAGMGPIAKMFKSRPMELSLYQTELYSNIARKNGTTGLKLNVNGVWVPDAINVKIVSGVDDIGKLVYDLTEVHVQKMRRAQL